MFGELNRYGHKLDPKQYHFQVARHISRFEYDRRRDEVDHFMRNSLRMQMAAFIAQERVDIRDEDDFSVEYRADLYVFNPDQFWGIVEGMAQEYASRFAPKPVFSEPSPWRSLDAPPKTANNYASHPVIVSTPKLGVAMGWYEPSLAAKGQWPWKAVGAAGLTSETITHWMPRPAAPEITT